MTRPPIRDLGHSVRERLANRARATGRPFQELLTYYALERFLYRLSASRHADRFVLKGALMLQVWDAPRARLTRDADLLGRGSNSVEDVEDLVREVLLVHVEPDGMQFDPTTVVGTRIREEQEYEGVRLRFLGYLQQARAQVQIDVGFGDVVVPGPNTVEYPTLLEGMPTPRLHGYTRESVAAEKFQAMVALGEIKSRYKDFYDIWFLATRFEFGGTQLAKAISRIFARRATAVHATPIALTDSFAADRARQAQWSASSAVRE